MLAKTFSSETAALLPQPNETSLLARPASHLPPPSVFCFMATGTAAASPLSPDGSSHPGLINGP